MKVQTIVNYRDTLTMLVQREKGTFNRVYSVMRGWSYRLAAEAAEDAPQGVTGDGKQAIAGSGYARRITSTIIEAGYGIPATVPYMLWINSGTDANGRPLPSEWFVPFKVAPGLLQWAQRIAGMTIETRPGTKWGFWPAGLTIRRKELHFLEPPLERNKAQVMLDLEKAATKGPDASG